MDNKISKIRIGSNKFPVVPSSGELTRHELPLPNYKLFEFQMQSIPYVLGAGLQTQAFDFGDVVFRQSVLIVGFQVQARIVNAAGTAGNRIDFLTLTLNGNGYSVNLPPSIVDNLVDATIPDNQTFLFYPEDSYQPVSIPVLAGSAQFEFNTAAYFPAATLNDVLTGWVTVHYQYL